MINKQNINLSFLLNEWQTFLLGASLQHFVIMHTEIYNLTRCTLAWNKLSQKKHVCLTISPVCLSLRPFPPPHYVPQRGTPVLSATSSWHDHHCPWPRYTLAHLTFLGNVYLNCSCWQQAHDGALKKKPVWGNIKGRRRRKRRERGKWGGV